MPYQTVQSDWERVNGEIAFNGKTYKYVKRKITNGEVVLMCLPDVNKMRIQSAKNDFFKNTTDVAQNNGSKKSDNGKTNIFKNLLSEYDQNAVSYTLALIGSTSRQRAFTQSDKLLSAPHIPAIQPPDII